SPPEGVRCCTGAIRRRRGFGFRGARPQMRLLAVDNRGGSAPQRNRPRRGAKPCTGPGSRALYLLKDMAKPVQELDRVIIRFAGDSGDGMQLTGGRFTSETAVFGNDLSTLPDFPAEIRAPAGSRSAASGFQVHFPDHDALTRGDA